MTNWYDVLQVPETANEAEIKTAYRRRAKETHPDRHGGDKAKEASFKRVQEAFAVLSDPANRAAFDAALGRSRSAANRSTPGRAEPTRWASVPVSPADAAPVAQPAPRISQPPETADAARLKQAFNAPAAAPVLQPAPRSPQPVAPSGSKSGGSGLAIGLGLAAMFFGGVALATANTKDANGHFHGRDGRYRRGRWG